MTLKFIKQAALSCGFNLCGASRCRELTQHREYLQNYLDNKYNGGLNYLERNVEKRLDPSLLVSGSKSIIVCAVSYNNLSWYIQRKNRAKIASYALAKDYHNIVREMLNELLEILKVKSPDLKARIFVDTAPILEKAWAVESGIGWIGKNSLLITPQFGSFVHLGEIVMDIELEEYSEPSVDNLCGECSRCIDNCPNGALIAPRILDASRCISRLTVEKNIGDTTTKYSNHNWLFGCDDCQSVCPFNQRAKKFTESRFSPVIDPTKLDYDYLANLEKDEFENIFKNTVICQKR